MKIKRIGMLLSLGLLSLSIASLINDNKEISETSTQIRTIELDKNKIDEDNFFNTFVNSNLEINEEEIIFTGLKKLKDFNISYDNVSELIFKFDLQGGKVLGGVLGADPSYFPKLFNIYGIEHKSLYNYRDIEDESGRAFASYRNADSKEKWLIVCAWNGKAYMSSAHYVAIKLNKNKKYEIFNAYQNSNDSREFDSISEYFEGELIAAFVLS